MDPTPSNGDREHKLTLHGFAVSSGMVGVLFLFGLAVMAAVCAVIVDAIV